MLVFVIVAACLFFGLRYVYPKKYSNIVEKYADKYGVDSELVYAVIKRESNFNPKAVSNVDAMGLMQLQPETFVWVQTKLDGSATHSEDELYKPEVNIKYGTYLLKLHLDEFGDECLALAAYHAGRGKVNEWIEDDIVSAGEDSVLKIPYADTQNYVKRVMSAKKVYGYIY